MHILQIKRRENAERALRLYSPVGWVHKGAVHLPAGHREAGWVVAPKTVMLPLDKSFHKVKCYSLTVTQASGTTASNVVRRKIIPRVQIRVAIKIYSFIHLFIYSFQKASKQRKQASKYSKRPMGRSTTDRPTADDRRPTDDRPSMIDDVRSLASATVIRFSPL